jgi:hypothetical protein
LLRLQDVRQVYLHGCHPLGELALFLRVEGAGSQGILLQANDLRRVTQVSTVADGASSDAITQA